MLYINILANTFIPLLTMTLNKLILTENAIAN
jgi:hypothetical protein